MKSVFLLSLCFFVGAAGVAGAEPASHETQLMKLAKAIKGGEPATWQERLGLKAAVDQSQPEEFLRQMAKKYVDDPKAALKLKQKVDELVRMIPQTSLSPKATTGLEPSAYDRLIQKIIDENLSWDLLFTGKSYQTTDQNTSLRGPENEFYERLNPSFSPSLDYAETIRDIYNSSKISRFDFAKDDQRVAGILTTSRFMDRYVNTALNKNRRRSAAVYRIALCDTMVASVPVQSADSQQGDYDVILPHPKEVTEDQLRKSMAGNIHGQQADCMKCHYKLDPLGQTFGLSAATLSIKPSPGALRYRGKDNRQVDIPLRGLGDLGDQLTRQPEFASCQVSHFWRWYIGKDVPLSPELESHLIKVFDDLGRKPKDFIRYLVSLPQFKEKPQVLTEDQLLSRRAVKIFKNCISCHESQYADVWDLSKLPYGTDVSQRVRRVNMLKKVLDTDGDGKRAIMPPAESLWKLSRDEFGAIKKWLDRGAPDFQGTRQVEDGGKL